MIFSLRPAAILLGLGMSAFLSGTAQAENSLSVHRIGFVAGAGGFTKMAITNQTFFDTLADAGYVRDKNLDVVFKTAEGDMTKMPSLVRQVLDQKVEILVVSSSPGCAAAKAATTTIPVLCISVQDDPVKAGLTADISYGTDNLVGVHSYLPTGIVEQLRLLKTIKPDLNILGIIYNPENLTHVRLLSEWKALAKRSNIEIVLVPASNASALNDAIKKAEEKGVQLGFALLGADTYAMRSDIAKKAIENHLPIAMDTPGGYTEMGGIATIGVDIVPLYRRGALELMIPLLNGKQPSELPWIGPDKVSIKINEKAAETFGLKP